MKIKRNGSGGGNSIKGGKHQKLLLYSAFLMFFMISMILQGCSGSREKTPIGTSQPVSKAESGETPEAEAANLLKDIKGETENKYRPEDDYFDYINGELLRTVKIPSDSSNWSYFYELQNGAYEKLDALLQNAVENRQENQKGSAEQKAAELYRLAMDMNGRNQAGLGGLQEYVDAIRSVSTVQEYLEQLGTLSGDLGTGSLLSLFFDNDMADSSCYACYVGGGDLILGKERLEDESQAKLHERFRQYVAAVMTKSGMEEGKAQQASQDIFSLLKNLAASSLPLSESGDPSAIYHVYTRKELCALAPNADLERMLDKAGVNDFEQFIVTEPEYIRAVNPYLTGEHLELLKNYTIFCLLKDYSQYLSKDIRDESLHFQQFQTGTESIKTDEKLASELAQGTLGFEFGQMYVKNYFSEESRQAVKEMAEQILGAYERKIDALDWMSRETKEAAKRKLKAMDLKIGYPDQWPDYYKGAEFSSREEGGVLIDQILELKRIYTTYQKEQARKPVDRTVWHMTPQTVNAYYNPLANEIVFPAAILQAPFYNQEADEAVNLGGIGTVIAHEITHAFDDSGAQFDEKGNYNTWWTKEDYEHFKERAQAVVEYYNGFKGFGELHVNGSQTLGENIADLGAVSCVMQIAGDDPETLRKLCTGYAAIWASKYTDESMKMRLNTDVHSPARVRVNAVLRSMDGFYLAYPEVKEGTVMYLEPEKRVKVW